MKNITVSELLEKNDGVILDVREVYEYETGHMEDAINLPLMGLLMNPLNLVDKSGKYYIICQSGVRSVSACEALEDLGYDVTNVLGGTSEYMRLLK